MSHNHHKNYQLLILNLFLELSLTDTETAFEILLHHELSEGVIVQGSGKITRRIE